MPYISGHEKTHTRQSVRNRPGYRMAFHIRTIMGIDNQKLHVCIFGGL
jgi:hypothetical protein